MIRRQNASFCRTYFPEQQVLTDRTAEERVALRHIDEVGTIRENLLLGKVDATEEEMVAVLEKSCADFVFHLPLGLDTPCSELGGGLSEGQAQRIAIARSLLRDRSVMIFDEATSALDPQTERQLLQNILSRHDRTVIFITHRPAVVDYCDQTLTIEKIQ